MSEDTEFDTGEEVTLEERPEDAKDAKSVPITPELIEAAMATHQLAPIRTKRGFTKPVHNKAKAKKARKAQRVARRKSRGTTSSRKGQKFTINHSAAK